MARNTGKSKKFLTEARKQQLSGLVKQYNKTAVAGYRTEISEKEVLKSAGKSWNDFQKTVKSLKKEASTPAKWEMSPRQRQQAEKLVEQFNSRVAREKLNMGLLNIKHIEDASFSWNAYQHAMGEYKRFLKKGATKVVGEDKTGRPIYKWEADLVSRNLPKVNAQRKAMREKTNFSTFSGSWGTPQFYSVQDKASPFVYSREKWELMRDYHQILKQSSAGYMNAKNEVYKNNFLTAISHIPDEDTKIEIMEAVRRISANDLVAAFGDTPSISISFVYEEKGRQPDITLRGKEILEKLKERGLIREQ